MVVSSNTWVVLMVAVMVDENDVSDAEIQSSWDGGKRGSLETWSSKSQAPVLRPGSGAV
jgi:hypothetical protein